MRADLIERLRRGRLAYRTNGEPVYAGPTMLEAEAADALEASLQSGLAEDVVKADPEIAEEAAAETEWTAKKAIYKKAKSLNIPVTHQQALELARSTLLVATPAKAAGGHPYEDFNAAINFAVDHARMEAETFLRSWREGDWTTLDREWPEWGAFVASPSPDGERQEGGAE